MVISPNWPVSENIRAFTTTRDGGVSRGQYAGLNLASHVDDAPNDVAENREILMCRDALPASPSWLEQVHGVTTLDLANACSKQPAIADAVYTKLSDRVCAILTADCLPILLCEENGSEVAAVHAGWRGLLNGVVRSALKNFRSPTDRIHAWLGPGISQAAYCVDARFRARFINDDGEFAGAFREHNDQWYADLYAIARYRLQQGGVQKISTYEGCTYAESQRFYSFRRDGVCGRMASVIWIASDDR